MTEDHSFDDLMARLQSGDADAAADIFKRFSNRLIALARSRLDRLPRQKADPEDVVQSVFRSFFIRQAHEPFDLSSWDNVWGMLTVITLRKCGHRLEYYRAARRDVAREVFQPTSTDDSTRSWQAIAREPTPVEAALLAETVEQVMSGLKERERSVLTLSLQGYSVQEISEQIGRTERTVRRMLESIKRRLEELRASSANEV
jgi:RNA polymerase sigma-70 factor (ECF subfamily)